MSRFYEVEVHFVAKALATKEDCVEKLQDFLDIKDEMESFDEGFDWLVSGYRSLGGGRSPEEAHEELKELLPGIRLASKWLCRDSLEWDDEIVDEDEVPLGFTGTLHWNDIKKNPPKLPDGFYDADLKKEE